MRLDLTGQRFERLIAIRHAPNNKHGQAMWLCRCDCGQERTISTHGLRCGQHKSCGCYKSDQIKKRRGDKHPNWTGGRHIHEDGYIRVYAREHPAASKRGYVLEHRIVMESKLGRYLASDEYVHHINGVKGDNRPENLELWVRMQPAGQRPEELVAWAREIIRRYGNSSANNTTGITFQ